MNFLVIEPNPESRQLLAEYFRYFALNVWIGDSWDFGVARLKDNLIDVCLINPETPGFLLTEESHNFGTETLWFMLGQHCPAGSLSAFWHDSFALPADLQGFQEWLQLAQDALKRKRLLNLPIVWEGDCLDRELIRTRTEIDVVLVTSMIDLFWIEGPKAIDQLTDLLAQCDAEKIKNYLHKIKGMFFNVGALRLGQICERLEQLPVDGSFIEHHEWLKSLKVSFALTYEQLIELHESLSV